MNELAKLMEALDASIEATHAAHAAQLAQVKSLTALRGALFNFAERVSLQSTLDAFPADGVDAVDPDALDPCPTVEELQEILHRAAGKLGVEKIREIIADEAGGKKVKDMADRERQLVRVSLELHGVKTR